MRAVFLISSPSYLLLSLCFFLFFSYMNNTMWMIPRPVISVATPISPGTINLTSGGLVHSAYLSDFQRGSGKPPISAGDLDFLSPRPPFPPPPQSQPLLFCNYWPWCRALSSIADLRFVYIGKYPCQVNALHRAENAKHVFLKRHPR
jgi:hypothetical protein